MKYNSTRSDCSASAAQAIIDGIAPDGGLYTPADFSCMQVDPVTILSTRTTELFTEVIWKLLPEFPRSDVSAMVEAAYTDKFDASDITPLEKIGDRFVLELYHGPTAAFKDVALSLLPLLLQYCRNSLGLTEKIVILTATSGDTGKAALEGFHDVEGTNIIVFYPDKGVSDIQRAQMVTQAGSNVTVCAVKGNFDDAQSGVKAVFADDLLNHWSSMHSARLTSANSINLGRLVPQTAYYFKAYSDLVLTGEVRLGDKVDFVVPTGNFGDILAGEFARRMGLPVGRLICASNANNVLTDFIRTGLYDRRREFHKTISPSMDILVSSNLERYLYLVSGGDTQFVSGAMRSLTENGCYQIPDTVLSSIRQTFSSYFATDEETMKIIHDVWHEHEYLIDPHTAAAWSAMDKYVKEGNGERPIVVLSTASPFKFARDVLEAVSGEKTRGGFSAMEKLSSLTNMPIPPQLAALRGKRARFRDCIEQSEMLGFVKGVLES